MSNGRRRGAIKQLKRRRPLRCVEGSRGGELRRRVDALIAKLDEIREDLPEDACFALDALVGQLDALNRQIDGIDIRLAEIHKTSSICRLLATIPGVGPITATAFAATIPDPSAFRSGREFAAWLGLTP